MNKFFLSGFQSNSQSICLNGTSLLVLMLKILYTGRGSFAWNGLNNKLLCNDGGQFLILIFLFFDR